MLSICVFAVNIYLNETVEQTVVLSVIWDAVMLIWFHCNNGPVRYDIHFYHHPQCRKQHDWQILCQFLWVMMTSSNGKFSASLAICAGHSPVPGEFPAQRPMTRSFDGFFICVWRNGWVNNRGAGDLRRHVVIMTSLQWMGPRFRPFLRDNTQTYAHSVISIRHYRVLFIRKSAKILLILTTKPRELSKCFNFVVTDDAGSFTTAKPGTCSVMKIIGVHHLTF